MKTYYSEAEGRGTGKGAIAPTVPCDSSHQPRVHRSPCSQEQHGFVLPQGHVDIEPMCLLGSLPGCPTFKCLRGPVTATCPSQPPLWTTSLLLWAQHDIVLHWMASLLAILSLTFSLTNKSNLLARALNKGRHLWWAEQWLPKSVQALIPRPWKYVPFCGTETLPMK